MAKTKGGQREKTKTSRNSSSKSSQAATSSKCSSDRQTTQAGRMRNRKKSGAELYKTRHNIGKRSAAGRVASYRETEVALLFPDGFFRPVVKVEAHNSEKDGGASVDNVQTPSKTDQVAVESKAKQSSESSESIKKPLAKSLSESLSSKAKIKSVGKKKNAPKPASAERKCGEEKKKAGKEASSSRETTRTAKERGKLVKGNAKSMKVLQIEGSPKKLQDMSKHHVDSESSLLQVSSPKDTSNDNKSGQTTKRKDKNAVQKTKGASLSSELSSPKVSKYFGLQPRAPRIKRTACLNAGAIMSAMYRDTPIMKKPKIDSSSEHIPAEKSAPKQSPKKHENDKPHTQKVTGPKKIENKKNFMSSGCRNLKKTSHIDINKKVKVKMKAKEKVKCRPHLTKKGKKVKVEESSEEESEKEEEHIPLWPPPRRMASLNAQAILAACTEERIKRPRAEGTPKVTRKQSVKKQKQIQAEDETSKKYDEECHEPSPEKMATLKPESEMESEPVVKSSEANNAVTHSQPVASSSSEQTASKDRQEPVTEPASKPNLPNQSPDVQIVEVKPPSYSGASVSRMNVGGYTSHSVQHARQTQAPVAFMPSSSSSFSYAAPSGHSSHGNQARYPGVPVQQSIPPHAPSGYALQHQSQRAYQPTHMAYPTQAPQHGHSILPSVAQHSAQKMYGQGQHLGHGPYPGHPQTRHRAPLASQSQASFQQQQQPQQHQQQQQQAHHHHHHHQLAPYQPSLTSHSSQNTIVQHSQSYHHHNYPIQQSHQAPTMPVLGQHAMASGTIYPGGVPMSVTKPKMEPRCSTPAQRFQAIGPKPEKPLMSYPTMPGSQGQQGSAPNHPHGPSPMGNTCTYPYPHSNHGNTQSDQCQSYMMSSMPVDNSATCTMMSFRHFGSAFTLHSYDEQQQEHTAFGFYQPAGPLIQTMPHDPCCIPEHMAMLVPRPQVKVLVHNTGSYPATNPYAALPDSSQPPIIPTKGSGTHHVRPDSSELKEKSQNTASTKQTKTAKELDHDKYEVRADARKENDDGKVFTTLEVAKKQLKNIDGRELLAQRTKLSSDPLLLQPIISERSSNSVHSEDKMNTEEPSVPVSQASVKTSTTDNMVSSSQTQQFDKPTDKLVGYGRDTQKDTPKNSSEMKDPKSAEQKGSEDQTTKSSNSVTTTTTSVTSVAEKVMSSVSSISTVSVAIASTTSVIDTQAKIRSDLMTVVTCSVSSNTDPKRCITVSTPGISSSASSPVTAEVQLTTTGTFSAATNTAFESSNMPVKSPVIKRAKPVKTSKKGGVLVPTTTSGPVTATSVVSMTTATMTTKSTSTQVKEASRKRKSSTSVDATAVKVSAVTSKDNGEVKSTDTLYKIKTKTPSKGTASKKGKCSGVSAGDSTVPSAGGITSADSQLTAAAKPLPTVIPPTMASVVQTAGSSSASSTSSVNTSLLTSQVGAMQFSTLQSVVVQSSISKTSDVSKTAGVTGGAVMSGITGVTSAAVGKPAMVTPSSAITPLFVSSTQKPMPDGKAGPTTAILPQGTVLLSNTGALNQPILMSAINNPAQITSGQVPLVSVPTGQVVMPVFLPAKSLAPTTGALAMTSVATSTLTTTATSGTAVSQMKMPLLQNSFSVTQANIALSGMMPPVFLSIPQPNTMGQTFLHLGGIKPSLQQIQLPVVSHQQVMVTQASQDVRTLASSKDEATLSAQGKKPLTSTQEPTEKNEVKVVTPKARRKKNAKDGTVENKTKDKVKTPAKKKANKTKTESTTKVTTAAAKSLPETALQATVKHHPVSTFGLSTIPQVVCSVSQVRSSTAPLLGCSSQSVQSQGKTNISHCADPVKSQTPLEMLQTVALGGQKVVGQAKDGLKVVEAVDGSKPLMNRVTQPGHKIDQNGALDLVMLSGLASKISDSKARTLKTPATKAKSNTPLKAPSGQSLATSIPTSPRQAAMLHSPPSLSHSVPAYSPGYTPSVLPVINKTCSSTSAVAYEDLIQDLSLPRQQQTSTPPKATDTKDNINKRDPATPIDLSKNKNKMGTKLAKSEGSKKCKKSKQATSSKQTTGKSKSSNPPAISTSSNINSSLPPSGFQYIAGIQIPVINRVHSLTSPGTKVATIGTTTCDTSKSQCVENQIVSSTTSSRSIGHQKVKDGDKSLSVSDVDKQLEKTTPTKGVISRGFQLKEVVERLHQANKELSDNSDRSDGESSPNKQKKHISGSLQHLTTEVMSSKKEPQQLQVDKLKQDQQSEANLKKSDGHQKDCGIKNAGDGDDYDDDDDDDDDEDALFIDMDCDPADNQPGISCSIENESCVSVTESRVGRSDQIITDERNQVPNNATEPSAGCETTQTGTCKELDTEQHSGMYNLKDESENLAQKCYVDEKQDESPAPSAAIGSDSSVCNSSSVGCIDSSKVAECGSWSYHVDSCSTNSSKPQSIAVKISGTSVVPQSNSNAETEQGIRDKDVTNGHKEIVAVTECSQDLTNSATEQATQSDSTSFEMINNHLDNGELQIEDADPYRLVTSVDVTSVTSNVKTVSEKSAVNDVDKNNSIASVDPSTGTDEVMTRLPGSDTTVDSTSVTEVAKDNNKAVAETNNDDRNNMNSTRKLRGDTEADNNVTHSLEDDRGLQDTGKPQLDAGVREEDTKTQSQNDNTAKKCTVAVPPKTDPLIDDTASGDLKADTVKESQKDVLPVDNTPNQLQTDDQCVNCPVACLPSDDNRKKNSATQSANYVRIDNFMPQSTESDNSVACSSETGKVVCSTTEGDTREDTPKNCPKTGIEVTNTTGVLPEKVIAVSSDITECTKEEATLDNTEIDSQKNDVRAPSMESSNDDAAFSDPTSEISDEKQVVFTEMESSSSDVKRDSPTAGLLTDAISVDVTTAKLEINTGWEDTTKLSDDSRVASTVTELAKENTRTEITETSSEISKDEKTISGGDDVTVSDKVVCEHCGMEGHSGQHFDGKHMTEHFLEGENCQRGKTSIHETASDEIPLAVSSRSTDVLEQNTDANIDVVSERLSTVLVSVDSASKASPAEAKAQCNLEPQNVMNTAEIKAQVKYPESENNSGAEKILPDTLVNSKSDVDKNEKLPVTEVTQHKLCLAEEQASMLESVASDTSEHITGTDESSQDTKAKKIIMAIDSLVSSSSFIEEHKHLKNDAPTEVTVEASDDENIEAVENGDETNHSGQNIQCGGTNSNDKSELKQEDKQILSKNGKDTVLNVSLSHAGLQQKINERPVIYPGKCIQLDVMEELNIICEDNDPGVCHLTGDNMCCPHSVNSIGVSCEDTDASAIMPGVRRAHSLSPNLHPQESVSKRISLGMGERGVEAALATETVKGPNTKKSPEGNPRRTSPRAQSCLTSKKEDSGSVVDDNPRKAQSSGKRKEDTSSISPPAKRALISPKRKDDKKASSELKKLSPGARKKEEKLCKPWRWEGAAEVKPVYTQVEGPPVPMTCYPAIRHDDGDLIRVRDCVLVKSGPRKSDIPYVAKIGALFEDPETREVMMSVLWFYRAEHTETERLPRYVDNEIFASRHRDVIPAVCIDDKCYVLTFNEYCRYHGEQTRIQQCLPPRPGIVPHLDSSELTRSLDHIPPLTASNETVFLCRRVYDVKLKRILKNPQVHIASHSGQ